MKNKVTKAFSIILVLSVLLGVLITPIFANSGISVEPQDDRNIFEIVYSGFLIVVGVVLVVIATVELIFEYIASSIGDFVNGIA